MGKAFRWSALFVAALVLTAIFEPPLMAFFASLGWHESPNEIPGDVVNWLAGIVGEQAFPWVAAGTLGIAAGTWLHWLATRFDQQAALARQDLASRLAAMALDLEILEQNVDQVELPTLQMVERYTNRIRSMEIGLSKLGITAPKIDFDVDPIGFIRRMRSYTSRMAPLLEDGHIKEAKRIGKELSATIRADTEAARLEVLQIQQNAS